MEGTLVLSTAATTITKTPLSSFPQSFRPRRITTTATYSCFQTSPSVNLISKSPFLSPHLCLSSSSSSASGDVSSSDVILLDVKGMMCGGCTSSVKRILENQAQVSAADVDLATETATVWPVSEAKVTSNWQKVIGEELAKNLTSCGFNSTLKGEAATGG